MERVVPRSPSLLGPVHSTNGPPRNSLSLYGAPAITHACLRSSLTLSPATPCSHQEMLAARPVPLREGSTHATVRRAALTPCAVHPHSRARVGPLRALTPSPPPPSSTPLQRRRGTNDRHPTVVVVANDVACSNPTDAARFRLLRVSAAALDDVGMTRVCWVLQAWCAGERRRYSQRCRCTQRR